MLLSEHAGQLNSHQWLQTALQLPHSFHRFSNQCLQDRNSSQLTPQGASLSTPNPLPAWLSSSHKGLGQSPPGAALHKSLVTSTMVQFDRGLLSLSVLLKGTPNSSLSLPLKFICQNQVQSKENRIWHPQQQCMASLPRTSRSAGTHQRKQQQVASTLQYLLPANVPSWLKGIPIRKERGNRIHLEFSNGPGQKEISSPLHYTSMPEGRQETQRVVKLQYKGLDYSILPPSRVCFLFYRAFRTSLPCASYLYNREE